jgi:hypothetical protein
MSALTLMKLPCLKHNMGFLPEMNSGEDFSSMLRSATPERGDVGNLKVQNKGDNLFIMWGINAAENNV